MKRLTVSVRACTETLSLLIAMAWADGRLDDAEISGVKGAVQVLNLTKEQRDRLDTLLKKPVSVADLELRALTQRDRAFAFVAAAWMAGVDRQIHPKEKALLEEIGAKLGLPVRRRAELVQVAQSLEGLPEGARNWGQEITKLFKAIPAELEEELGDEDFEVVFEEVDVEPE